MKTPARLSGFTWKQDEFRSSLAVLDMEDGNTCRETETTWTGSAGIDDERVTRNRLNQLPMGMPVDDDVGVVRLRECAGGGGAELVAVAHMHADAAESEVEVLWEVEGRIVHVAVNGMHRGDPAQFSQHAQTSNITGVENHLHAVERGKRFRAHQAMRVRDESDAQRGSVVERTRLLSEQVLVEPAHDVLKTFDTVPGFP